MRIQAIRALADRGDSAARASLPLAKLVREKLADDDAFVRRAAADCLGRHPEQSNVKPLLDLWRTTSADDPQLIHTIRMALRDHLKLPELLAAVASRDPKFEPFR